MSMIKKHISMLGLEVVDRVTGFAGVVSSVSFDLYGCVQALVNPGVGSDGKLRDSSWFDVNRLHAKRSDPVMDPPDFEAGPQAEGRQGAAEKPALGKS